MNNPPPNRRIRYEDVYPDDDGAGRSLAWRFGHCRPAGPLEDRIAAGDTIRIGFANEIPFAYPGEDGTPKGFVNAEVIGVLAKMGYTNIETVETEWGGLIPGLNAGQFDIITGGMNILAARCENIAFSEPMAKIGDGFIVAPGNPKGIQTYTDVKDKAVMLVTGAGYSNIDAAKAAGVTEDQIMIVPGPTEILRPSPLAGPMPGPAPIRR